MGSKYTVLAYVGSGNSFVWSETWRGKSIIKCILAARKAHKIAGAVKIEWRP